MKLVRIALALLSLASCLPAWAHHREKYLPTVYIEPNSDFEGYVELAFMRREVMAEIVARREDADFVIGTVDLERKYDGDVEGSRPSTSRRYGQPSPAEAEAEAEARRNAAALDNDPAQVTAVSQYGAVTIHPLYPGGPYPEVHIGPAYGRGGYYGGDRPRKPKSDFEVAMYDKFGTIVLAMKVGKYADEDKDKQKMAKELVKQLNDFFKHGQRRQ